MRGYSVECRKDVQITCAIERETSSATTAHRFTLGSDPKAVVRERRSQGPDRILLYLVSVGEVFAAEFEGGSALSEAEAAAARLNGVFAATQPSEARVDVAPPPICAGCCGAPWPFGAAGAGGSPRHANQACRYAARRLNSLAA